MDRQKFFFRVGLWTLAIAGLTSCTRPGEGGEASRAFACVEPVFQALEQYQQDSNRFPETLDSLAPAVITQAELEQLQQCGSSGVRYQPTASGYELRLRHGGRLGQAECWLESGGEGWACRRSLGL